MAARRKDHAPPATTRVADIYDAFAYFAQLLNARHSMLDSRSDGVTGAQVRALRRLERGPLAMGALSERLYVQRSTVSGMVDRLEAKGLVERRRSERDKRRVEVALTPAGRAFVASAPQSVIQLTLDRLHALPLDELEQLHGAVLRMREMLADSVAEVCGSATPEEWIA